MIGYWWPMKAHGFPVTHLRFWVHEALPWILSAFCLLGMVLAWHRYNKLFSLIILTVPVIYAAVAIAGVLVFPNSATRDLRRMFDPAWLFDSFLFKYGFWLPLLCCAGMLGLLAALTTWRRRFSLVTAGLAVTVGTCIGVTFVWAQRADEPSTHPVAQLLPSLPEQREPIQPEQVSFAADMTFDPQTATVQLKHEGLEISVRSTLIFHSVSLERCWTMLAPLEWYKRYKIHFASAFCRQDDLYFAYEGGNQALVRINNKRQETGALELETWTYLPEPVFSHLNSFTTVTVNGYTKLSISLSPFPQKHFELRPHAHPVYWIDQGFAFLDASGAFHWAKGTRGEHGPFHYLMHGQLKRGDPVILTILDEGRAACRIILYDWTDQVSTALSPTAGWGVPANAIVAWIGPTSRDNIASISFTLAATHVGGGHDTVGHKAGAYRNRITIEPL
jgi:hypothetical protein